MRFVNTYSSTNYTGANSCNMTLFFLANDYFDNQQSNIFDIHFETTVVANAFCLDGGASATAPIIRAFRYSTEHASQVSNSIFKILGTSSIASVRVDDLDLSVTTSPQTVGAPQKIFDDPTKWSVSGRVYVSAAAMWSAAPASFNGNLCIANACTLKMTPIAVLSLPTCNAANEGAFNGVTDANSTTYNATAATGGGNHMPVYCNGTNWVLH